MHRIFLFALIVAGLAGAQTRGFQSADLLKLRSVADVQWSPDGSRIAYTVSNNDGPRRPYSQLWIMTVADDKSIRLAVEKESSSGPEWSPDGQWIAYVTWSDDGGDIWKMRADGSGSPVKAIARWCSSSMVASCRSNGVSLRRSITASSCFFTDSSLSKRYDSGIEREARAKPPSRQ